MASTNDLMTESEPADYCRVRLRTMQRWRTERRGPPVLWAGNKPRYSKREVDAWLRAGLGSEVTMEGISEEDLARDQELLDIIAKCMDENKPVPVEVRIEHLALRRAFREALDSES